MAQDLVFIVSGGRTGTRFIGERIAEAVDNCRGVHEPDVLHAGQPLRVPARLRDFGLWHMTLGRILGRTGVRNLVRRRFVEGASDATLEAAIRGHRDAFHRRVAEPLLVESCYQWYGLLPQLRAAYPQAKIVGVIRDPRDWVRSFLDFGGHHDRRDAVRWLGGHRIRPTDVDDAEGAALWPRLGPFGRLCWDWRFVYRLIVPFAWSDARTRIYRYEDLFAADDEAALRDLVAFVAEHGERRYAHALPEGFLATRANASRPRSPEWPDWSHEAAALLDRLCGPLMRRYGYGEEPAWREKVARGRESGPSE